METNTSQKQQDLVDKKEYPSEELIKYIPIQGTPITIISNKEKRVLTVVIGDTVIHEENYKVGATKNLIRRLQGTDWDIILKAAAVFTNKINEYETKQKLQTERI